jgi:hypothetical protein
MTWKTIMGERVLEGVEAEVYLTAMQNALVYLDDTRDLDLDEPEFVTGDRIFDIASFEQKTILLHRVLSALLDPDVEPLMLTNTIEAAAYFPFAFLKMQLGNEIPLAAEGVFDEDEEFKYYYRDLIWKAFEQYILPIWQDGIEEFGENEELDSFHDRSDNLEVWEFVVEDLADRIFWDRDWEISSYLPQVLDGIEESLSEAVGLDDYFTNRLPQVTSARAAVALAEIHNWKLGDEN